MSPDRWRAYIVRIPGVPTALMPFYGRTPAEAAQQLSDWLTRASRDGRHPPEAHRLGSRSLAIRQSVSRRIPLRLECPAVRRLTRWPPSSCWRRSRRLRSAPRRPTSSDSGASRRDRSRPGARPATATCGWRRSPTAAAPAISTFRRSSSSRCGDAARGSHPALVWVHEDIRGHLYEHYIPYIREATARGYVVIAPEYRGSIGYGQAFYDAIDYGGARSRRCGDGGGRAAVAVSAGRSRRGSASSAGATAG